MTRSYFQWQLPPDVTMVTTFSSYTDKLQVRWVNHYTAVCQRCGAEAGPRASRADAIDDLEAHQCP